jgi:hypothetical protein
MKKIIFSALTFLLIAWGCSSSKITSSWKADNIVPEKYNKIMVLGLIREVDRSLQEQMEDHLVGDLQNMGCNAVSSLKIYGPKAFDNMDETAALNKIKNSGIDAVITIVLLDKQKERKYVPGNLTYSPYGYYYDRFWGYRSVLYQRIYQPGYYVTDTKYFWESNFYEMTGQKLIYSVQTKSFDPANKETMAHEYGMMIVKDMEKQHILTKQSAAGEPTN